MSVIIKVENISKKYIIRHQSHAGYSSLRDVVANSIKNVGRSIFKPSTQTNRSTREEFFALRDVSFEINQGERIGIIGRNGAGKSTLLKLLSRITDPSAGKISMNGRVASLLEVGTGFHPELTGRENVFMNGSILGMSRAEIKSKFDEIVAFAEVEKFLDTPVKRYSSGMYVRLAFAVAAHLEPEILLVDEVLAVGDAGFQKKCLGKMEDVSRNEGRTVLFVSHNMAAVASLTTRCIELAAGSLINDGPSQPVIQEYIQRCSNENVGDGFFDLRNIPRQLNKIDPLTSSAQFLELRFLNSAKQVTSLFEEREQIEVEVKVHIRKKINQYMISLVVSTIMDVRVFAVLSDKIERDLDVGIYTFSCTINPNYLRPGYYFLSLGFWGNAPLDGVMNACTFKIEPSSAGDTNVDWAYDKLGLVRFPYSFSDPQPIKA